MKTSFPQARFWIMSRGLRWPTNWERVTQARSGGITLDCPYIRP